VCNSYPQAVAEWPITTTLTTIDISTEGVALAFSKQDGPDRWPDVTPPGWSGSIQYTLWIAMQIDGRWYTNGPLEYWYGLARTGGNILAPTPDPFDDPFLMQIPGNWTYDCGIMARQPAPGELVGFFVTAGDQRKKDVWAVHERSNVVVFPFPTTLPVVITP
jgi:hypothetical protein